MTLEQQRELVFSAKPEIHLISPCSINRGILRLSQEQYDKNYAQFLSKKHDLAFFIPASGSGSRMFEFLHNFFKDPAHKDRNKVERFLNSLNEFALTRLIPDEVQERMESGEMNLAEFASYVVEDKGLNLGSLPKGLIPFHENNYFVLNPFQEHVLQIALGFGQKTQIHFTINRKFEDAISSSINQAKMLASLHPKVSFSEQNPETDSYVFDEEQNALKNSDGSYLRRPAGHGALLENLNSIDARYIFLKNIDNIQHFNHDSSVRDFAMLGGLLDELNSALLEIKKAPQNTRKELFQELNKRFELFQSEEDFPNSEQEIHHYLNKPKRICGMVKNEGQPGGGPFWVMHNGKAEKQIVEKAQITDDPNQLSILLKSTHFNPVMIACDVQNLDGEKINLLEYTNANKYMVVEKSQAGQKVLFMEKPGLWNGGMAHWISIFVEVSSDSFSPVKDVLNLLDKKHRP